MTRLARLLLAVVPLAASCGDATAPAFPVGGPPTRFRMSVDGFGFGTHNVTLAGDTLVIMRRADFRPDSATVTRVVPTSAEWGAFWRAADDAGARSWPRECSNPDVADGGGFDLSITYPGGSVESQGVNSYPYRNGRCSRDPASTPEYTAFLAAVAQLIRRPFP